MREVTKQLAGEEKRCVTLRGISVVLREFYRTYDCCVYSVVSTQKRDLYTSQNPKKARYVDNMVDNVDKGLWITHTVFVNNRCACVAFTHGKTGFHRFFLQEFLPGVFAIFRRKCRRDRLLDPMKTIEKRKKCPYYAAFFES